MAAHQTLQAKRLASHLASLGDYAKKFDASPGWLFPTGQEEDITLLRKKLSLFIEEIQDVSKDHNMRLIVGNEATGRGAGPDGGHRRAAAPATEHAHHQHHWAVKRFGARGRKSEIREK